MIKKGLVEILRKHYPKSRTALRHKNPFQLLIATILSAQCTDERVNSVTPRLFRKYPTPDKLGKAERRDVEEIIRPTGFYRNKAGSIIKTAEIIAEKHGGKVPESMEELLKLKGVARKTANVVLGDSFGIAEGVVVDTHVKRLAFRMGLTESRDPLKVERDLMKALDRKDWIWFSHALISHGRKVCGARKPDCAACALGKICPKIGL